MATRNRLFSFIRILVLLTLMISCDRRGTEPSLAPLSADDIDGERLWERITVESDFQDYAQWPTHDGMRPGQSPHGVWHTVYGNNTLFEALPAVNAEAPDGAIIVKENFDADKVLRSITVMAKVSEWDEANGDWFWASYGPDGTINAEGSLGGCISCHEGMKDNDYVIISPLDEKP